VVYVALWARKFFFDADGSALVRVRRTTTANPAGSEKGA
jgi:hypothetical protein